MSQCVDGHVFGNIGSIHRSVEGILDAGGSDMQHGIAVARSKSSTTSCSRNS
jgi:hypothetical protein